MRFLTLFALTSSLTTAHRIEALHDSNHTVQAPYCENHHVPSPSLGCRSQKEELVDIFHSHGCNRAAVHKALNYGKKIPCFGNLIEEDLRTHIPILWKGFGDEDGSRGLKALQRNVGGITLNPHTEVGRAIKKVDELKKCHKTEKSAMWEATSYSFAHRMLDAHVPKIFIAIDGAWHSTWERGKNIRGVEESILWTVEIPSLREVMSTARHWTPRIIILESTKVGACGKSAQMISNLLQRRLTCFKCGSKDTLISGTCHTKPRKTIYPENPHLGCDQSYNGQWTRGQRHGQGSCTFSGGVRYVGSWQYGKRHGMGKEISVNGDVYTGQYKEGWKHGEGTHCHRAIVTKCNYKMGRKEKCQKWEADGSYRGETWY